MIGNIKIGGDLAGGSADATTTSVSGSIFGNHIASVAIGGSVIAGAGVNGGALQSSTTIGGETFGSITIAGNLIGNSTSKVTLSASGNATTATTPDTAIKSLTIKGRVEYTQMYFGFNFQLEGVMRTCRWAR